MTQGLIILDCYGTDIGPLVRARVEQRTARKAVNFRRYQRRYRNHAGPWVKMSAQLKALVDAAWLSL